MRRLAVLVWCAALLSLARPRPAPAACTQAPPRPIEPGARIRFDALRLGTQLTGTLVSWESDTLVVQVDGDAPDLSLLVHADSVTRLDVRRERRMVPEGVALGALAGVLLALVASPDVVDENGDCTTLECIAYHASPQLDQRLAVLTATGVVLGTILGASTKTPTWVTVPVQRLAIGATRDGGLMLGVRISF
jgi:hypothetical protein